MYLWCLQSIPNVHVDVEFCENAKGTGRNKAGDGNPPTGAIGRTIENERMNMTDDLVMSADAHMLYITYQIAVPFVGSC